MTGSAANCSASCSHQEIGECAGGDGCCPAGCDANFDTDCSATCGNGVVEGGETCDGDCPSACDDGVACTRDNLTGSVATCSAACAHPEITQCKPDDGCCPAGCDANSDNDCSATCGNGVVEAAETCDGSCPAGCDDGEACTIDELTGSAASCSAECSHQDITECRGGDDCCPAGCDHESDDDCRPPAGSCAGLPEPVDAVTPAPRFGWFWSNPEQRLPEGVTVGEMALTWLDHAGVMLAFDPATGTWTWDGAAWSKAAEPDAGPGATATSAKLVYDPTGDRALLYGGEGQGVWTWEGQAWTQHAPDGAAPWARTNHGLAWDDGGSRLLVFGGRSTDGATLDDLWSWSDTGWTSHSTTGGPGSVQGAAVTWDEQRRRLIVFGGTTYSSSERAETWEWDGTDWAKKNVSAPLDTHWGRGAMVYDSSRGLAVLVGGDRSRYRYNEKPWSWDGARWTELDTGSTGPSGKIVAHLVRDPSEDRFIVTIIQGLGWGSLRTFKEVQLSNHAPYIAYSSYRYRVWAGKELDVSFEGTDADEDELRFVSPDLPAGAQLDEETGRLTWTPTEAQVGEHTFELGVTDGEGCGRREVHIEVVSPRYTGLPEGGYQMFDASVSIPSQYVERPSSGPIRIFEVASSSPRCSLLGENPGKLDLVCTVSFQRAWYSGGIGSTIWYDWSTYIGTAPVEPDGSFSLYAGYRSMTFEPSGPYVVPSDLEGMHTEECPTLRGDVVPEDNGQLGISIDHFTTYCWPGGDRKGARTHTDEDGPFASGSMGFRGVYGSPEEVVPNVPMEGWGLGGVTFWHPVEERYIQVDGPFWMATGNLVKDLDGNTLATAGRRIPTLDSSIKAIYRDAEGRLVVER